ncbi:MAG: hypothetical protein ACRC3J_05085 [Culicoidibacterales bacterium]
MKLTLKDLRKFGACFGGYNNFVSGFFKKPVHLSFTYHPFTTNEKFTIKDILETSGVEDAVWSFSCLGKKHHHTLNKIKLEITALFLKHIESKKFRKECKRILTAAELFVNGGMSQEEFQTLINKFNLLREYVSSDDYSESFSFARLDTLIDEQTAFSCIYEIHDDMEEKVRAILLTHIA